MQECGNSLAANSTEQQAVMGQWLELATDMSDRYRAESAELAL